MTKMDMQKQATILRPMSAGPRANSPYIPKPQKEPAMRGVLDLTAALPMLPMSPPPGAQRSFLSSPANPSARNRGNNAVPLKMFMGSKDKEALLEEVMELKRVLYEQSKHIKIHKVQTSSLEIENKNMKNSHALELDRKLEKDIEDLEAKSAVDAPRSGGSSRLRAKLQGLKSRISDIQTTCDAQSEELALLRKDMRVSHTRDVEVERDAFAGEVENLQKLLRRLNTTHNRISCQNKELGRLKDKASLLEASHHRLETAMHAAQEDVERATQELKCYRNRARETALEAHRHTKKCKDVEQHSNHLQGTLEKEKAEKQYMEKKVFSLTQEFAKMEAALAAAKGYARNNAFKGDAKKKQTPSAPLPVKPKSDTASVKSAMSAKSASSGSTVRTPKSPPPPPPPPPPDKKKPQQPQRVGQQQPHHSDVVDITNKLVNMASFHFEQSFKNR